MSTTMAARLNAYPVVVDAAVRQGDSYRESYVLKLDDGAAVRAVNLSEATFWLRVLDRPGGACVLSASEVADWTCSGIMVTDAAAGRFVVWLTAADTATVLGRGSLFYEVGIQFAADDADLPSVVKTLLVGRLAVVADAA